MSATAAVKILDALIILNESIFTADQIMNIVRRMRDGEVPTEEEIDAKVKRNMDFIERELARIGQ